MTNLTPPTADQIARCTRKVDASTNAAYYEVQSENSTTKYEVRYNRQFHCFTCTCPSGKEGFLNCHVNPTCKHCRWSVAAEQEYQTAKRLERDADIEDALASRSPEEVSEQAEIQHIVAQGIDLATAERIVYAAPAEPGPKGSLGYNKGFSLLR